MLTYYDEVSGRRRVKRRALWFGYGLLTGAGLTLLLSFML